MVSGHYFTDNAAVAPWKARLSCLQSSPRVAALTFHPAGHAPARWPPTEGSVNMAKEQHGTWFGFGFCGFGQVLGSGNGRHSVHSPEPLCASEDVCRVSASWSYTALVTREYPHNPTSKPVPCTPAQPFLICLPRNTVHPLSGNLAAPLPGSLVRVPPHSLPTQVEAGWSCQAP